MNASPITDIHARIAAIQARFPVPSVTAPPTARPATQAQQQTSALPLDFASVLNRTQQTLALAAPQQVQTPAAPGRAGTDGERVIEVAKRYLGVPYLWGGTDPSKGLDCSGFVQLVYKQLGIKLPRVSVDQARQGVAVPSLAQARPGDLVFWRGSPNHIGIYAGDGKMIVAPRTGDVVKIQEIRRTPHEIRRVLP